MLDLSQTLEHEAARFLRELCRHRSPDEKQKTNAVLKDQYGDVRKVVGGMFRATGGRDAHLSIHGLTRADVTAFREAIEKRLGFAPPCAMAEALLIQTRDSAGDLMDDKTETRRARERAKKAKRRKWAIANGYCRICCKNAASYTAEGDPMKTCQDCRDRVVRNRKQKA